MNVNNRIKEIIRLLANNKQNIFSNETGIPASTLSGIVGSIQNAPSFISLRRILDAYPSLSVQWLLYGVGESLLSHPKQELSPLGKDELNRKDTEISERVSLLIKRLSSNPHSFATDLGYEKTQTIYDIINGRSAPSYDFFRRFMLSEYSEIVNLNWLLTGRGKMIVETEAKDKLEASSDPMELAILRMIRKLAADNAILEKENEYLKQGK